MIRVPPPWRVAPLVGGFAAVAPSARRRWVVRSQSGATQLATTLTDIDRMLALAHARSVPRHTDSVPTTNEGVTP